MKKNMLWILSLLTLFFSMSGFTSTTEKAASIAVVYGITAGLSVVVFFVYIFFVKKKSPWFILLFSSVFVVNIGYLALSISKTLEEALLANRIAYLGSVFLPMSILMIILDITDTKYKKWFTGLLIAVGITVFFIAASPGYLDIYYKEVSLVVVNGVSTLKKVYGPLHIVYLFYLMIYFSSMIILTVIKTVKKKIESTVWGIVLLCSVFVNIGVWLLEQFVRIDFEILSVSYVITELFLLCLCFLMQESDKNQVVATLPLSENGESTEKYEVFDEKLHFEESNVQDFFETPEYKIFMDGLGSLTNTEHKIYDFYIEGKTTKEILELLDITENTLKFHNKNIYGKLGVSSRKQLKDIAFKIMNQKDA